MGRRGSPLGAGWRRWVRKLHLWIALALCLPLALLGLTGSILVFEEEIAAWTEPPRPAPASGTAQPIDRIVAAARRAAPQNLRPVLYIPPAEPGEAAKIRFAPPGRGRGPGGVVVAIDPVSLTPLATESGDGGWLRTIFRLHANALMSPAEGRPLIGWLGAAMMVLAISGLVIWWPRSGRWKAAFLVRRDAPALKLNRDLHGAVGIWTLPVFLIVGLTGLYLSFPRMIGGAVSSLLPARDLRATAMALRVEPVPGALAAGPEAMAALARSHARPGRLLSIGLPSRPDQPYRIAIAPDRSRAGAPPITVFADPWRGKVVEVRDPQDYSAGEKLLAWQHPLHAGAGLGLIYRLLVFVSGVLPAFFVVTGTTIWLLRRRHGARRAQTRPAAAP